MRLLFLVNFIVLPVCLISQTFSLRYDTYDWVVQNSAFNIEETGTDFFLSAASVQPLAINLDIQFLEIGPLGDLLTQSVIGNDTNWEYNGEPNSMDKTIDGGFILGCSLSNLGNDSAVVWKLDFNAAVEWKYVVESDSIYIGYSSTQGMDSCYFLTGSTNDVAPSGNYGAFLLKLNQQGEFVWLKKYPASNYFSYGKSITATPDGGMLLGCQTTEWDDDQDHDFMIIKTDSLGNEQWRKKWGGSVYSSGAAYVNIVSDSNYVMCSALEDGLGPNNVAMKAYAAKIDTTGEFVWQNQYGPYSYPILLTKIEECTDGSFITAGMKQEQFNYHGLLMKLSSSGDSLWYRTYTYADELLDIDCILRDVIQTSDGGYIACGYTDAITDEESRDVWVLKVDSVGCLVPGCDVSILEEKQIANFLVYPNPANEVVNVYFESLFAGGVFQLYDTNGKLVKRFEANENKSTYILEVSNLTDGIYLLQFTAESGYSTSKKINVHR